MNFFWNDVFEYFKDRRVAGIFFGTLLCLAGALLAAALLLKIMGFYVIYVVLAAGGVLLLQSAQAVRRALRRRRDRYKSSPLSRDELNKARSKLMRTKP
jgi:hypothetical protein